MIKKQTFETLLKNTPMLVMQTYEEEDNSIFDCPNCKFTWHYIAEKEVFKYCANCGQKLEWESENDE